MKRTIASAAAIVAATAGIVVAAPSPAQAASCNPTVGTTYRDGNTILGSGGGNSCSSQYRISIQWSRWFGWDEAGGRWGYTSGPHQSAWFNCSGTGTHDFRTRSRFSEVGIPDAGGATSNVIRASC